MQTSEIIEERLRLPSPAPQPQALASDGEHLWLGSWTTRRIYGIDPLHGTVFEEASAPGGPVGAVAVGDELRVICSEGEEDHRFIRRYIPAHGFKDHDAIPCPEDTGSFIAYDGRTLWISQRYNKRVIQLDENYAPAREIAVGAEIIGIVWVEGALYLSTWLGKADGCRIMRWRDGEEIPQTIGSVPFAGISLTHDGTRFWTNDFKANALVALAIGS